MSALPHTLDNLCKDDKDKVVEMLRQVNELKKRCSSLEEDLANRTIENERLSGREEVIARQLEATRSKLYETVEESKNSQTQIESLSQKLQEADAEKKLINTELEDAEAEVRKYREIMNDVRMKYEKIQVTTAVQCRPPTLDENVNTIDTALDLTTSAAQTISLPKTNVIPSTRVCEVTPFHVTSPVRNDTTTYVSEVDRELDELISLLNP